MKIGISTWYKKMDIISGTFRDYNIQHVQIGFPADVNLIKNDLYSIINKFKISNPDIELSVHAYPFNLAEKVEEVRKIWIELSERTISFASKIGASFVNFHIGYGIDAPKRSQHEELLNLLSPVLFNITEYGTKNNVEIHIENLYSEQGNSDFCKLGDRLSDFKKIFDSIDSPKLKLCYDYGHGNLDEHGIDILHNFSHQLGSIHAHDNDQLTDIHWAIGNKGQGTIDWKEELQYLNTIEFAGAFILESYVQEQLKSLDFLKESKII